jgi:hypothetical protein
MWYMDTSTFQSDIDAYVERESINLVRLQQLASAALSLSSTGARLLASGSTYDVFVLAFEFGDNAPPGGMMERCDCTCIESRSTATTH